MGKVNELFESLPDQPLGSIVGKLVEVDAKGRAMVDFKGNPNGPVAAETIVSLPPSQAVAGKRLLLTFDENDVAKPIIVGIVGPALVVNPEQTVTLPLGVPDATLVDGKKVRFDAKEQIELVCGKSSILLRKDGKIVIKGRNILNRAMETNKLKGGNVAIN